MNGPILSRMIKLHGMLQNIEHPIDIDDCTNVYGDSLDLFPYVETPCDKSPSGQCEFNALAPDHERCIHCGRN